MQETLLRVGEVADRLRVSRLTVYRRIHDGSLGAVRVGEHGPLRVPAAAVDDLLLPATRETRPREAA